MDRFWRLPQNISTFGDEIDGMFHIIAWLTIAVFFLVEILLIWFLIRYRAREGRRATYTHGNNRMEVMWTAATALIVVVLGVMSRGLWLDIKDPRRFPEPGLELTIVAKQFEWNVTYPGPDGELETGDDFTVRNRMDVPIDRPTHVILHAEDVIHSFFVPDFRVKQDAVPGMTINVMFTPTKAGTYEIACAELCGVGHYIMRGKITVEPQQAFDRWLAAQAPVLP